MSANPLKIPRFDTREYDVAGALADLRERLSPREGVVSEAGRRRTIEVFGEPLTPTQVVERICNDVRSRRHRGRAWTIRLESIEAQLTPQTIRVPAADLAAAHAAAVAGVFGDRAADSRQHPAVSNGDSAARRARRGARRRVSAAAVSAAAASGNLRARRGGGVSVDRADDRRAGPSGGRASNWRSSLRRRRSGPTTPICWPLATSWASSEVYRMGGAQAVAALAYGVEGIPRVDKIVGPGNLFVALAKKFVFGEVDIDSIAGPSEVVVIADDTAKADSTAADLIAQAEHAPGASVLITWSARLLDDVAAELDAAVGSFGARRVGPAEPGAIRGAGAGPIGRRSGRLGQPDCAGAFAHRDGRSPSGCWKRFRNAGAAFLGHFSPVALGDYAAGPSHVLPTGGTARFASGLSANDFLRSGSVIAFTAAGLEAVADDIRVLAEKEGLTAHWASVRHAAC